MSQSGLDAPHRNKSEMHARLKSLDFGTSNNAALSLTCIAEWLRIGKLQISVEDRSDDGAFVRLVVRVP